MNRISQELDAETVIRLLELAPHPEGGHFRGTAVDASGRAASTAIYFLLKSGEVSRWHTVDAAEIWNWYAGAPLKLSMAHPNERARHFVKSAQLADGPRPQAIVPAGVWKQSQSLGAWTLAGCIVAPGFPFEGVEMAPQDTEPPFSKRSA